MKLIRSLLSLAFLAALIYGAVKVPLGGKTLWQHIQAIASTREGKELVDGVKEKAGELKNEAARILKADAGPKPGGGEQDNLTDKEREALRKLIREKMTKGVSD